MSERAEYLMNAGFCAFVAGFGLCLVRNNFPDFNMIYYIDFGLFITGFLLWITGFCIQMRFGKPTSGPLTAAITISTSRDQPDLSEKLLYSPGGPALSGYPDSARSVKSAESMENLRTALSQLSREELWSIIPEEQLV